MRRPCLGGLAASCGDKTGENQKLDHPCQLPGRRVTVVTDPTFHTLYKSVEENDHGESLKPPI